MMRGATSVWKAARERCGAPECPSNMSEPQWAVLLFGNLCQVCKIYSFVKGISVLTLGLNDLHRIAARKIYPSPNLPSCVGFAQTARRISKSIYVILFSQSILFLSRYLGESRFKTRYPDVDPGVLELIPYTNGQYILACVCMANLIYYEVSAWSYGYGRGSRFFWKSDIDAMLRKLAEYEHNIHLRHPGAQQALRNFKNQRNEMVASIRKVSFISSYRTVH